MSKWSPVCVTYSLNISVLQTKRCTKCQQVKELSKFYNQKDGKYHRTSRCKTCIQIRDKHYYQNNKDKSLTRSKQYHKNNKSKCRLYSKRHYQKNKKQILQKHKIYRQHNKETIRQYHKNYCRLNKERRKQYNKIYTQNNRNSINKRVKQYRTKNQLNRLKHAFRVKLYYYFKQHDNRFKSKTTFETLGYSAETLHKHLLQYINHTCQRCQKIKMTWNSSQIDHIIPISLARTNTEVVKLNHYTNLRLICADCNLEKSDKLDFDNATLPDFAQFYIDRTLNE